VRPSVYTARSGCKGRAIFFFDSHNPQSRLKAGPITAEQLLPPRAALFQFNAPSPSLHPPLSDLEAMAVLKASNHSKTPGQFSAGLGSEGNGSDSATAQEVKALPQLVDGERAEMQKQSLCFH